MRRVNFTTPVDDLAALSGLLDRSGAEAIRTWTSGTSGYADCCIDNRALGAVLADVGELEHDIVVSFAELDELVLHTGEDPSSSLDELSHRSPAEVYLAALHSFGSWTSFLG